MALQWLLLALAQIVVGACDPIAVDATTSDAGEELDAVFTPDASVPFSFFVTSLDAMRSLSGSEAGFGGDLRFGETGAAAGIRGADKICAAVAMMSFPGADQLTWRAFLSTSTEHAASRIGAGPWHDRRGRLVAVSLADLLSTRPLADPSIANDLPNEWGLPNSDPWGTGTVDNHDVLTGSDAAGMLYAMDATCDDWTSRAASGHPRVGHAWKRTTSRGAFESFISAHDAPGCAAGVTLVQGSTGEASGTVGGGGGYGALYCFAVAEAQPPRSAATALLRPLRMQRLATRQHVDEGRDALLTGHLGLDAS